MNDSLAKIQAVREQASGIATKTRDNDVRELAHQMMHLCDELVRIGLRTGFGGAIARAEPPLAGGIE
jgi:hypothetical protein